MQAMNLNQQKQVRGGIFWFVFLGVALIATRAVGAAVASGLRSSR